MTYYVMGKTKWTLIKFLFSFLHMMIILLLCYFCVPYHILIFQSTFSVEISYFEIYNEKIHDLLDYHKGMKDNKKLNVSILKEGGRCHFRFGGCEQTSDILNLGPISTSRWRNVSMATDKKFVKTPCYDVSKKCESPYYVENFMYRVSGVTHPDLWRTNLWYSNLQRPHNTSMP